MKIRILSTLLAIAMLLTMTACGSGAASGDSAEKSAEASAEAAPTEAPAEASEAPAVSEAPAEAEASAEASAEAEEEPQFEGTLEETSFFSFVYGDDWTFDPENDLTEYDDYCYVSPQVPGAEGESDLVYVNITVEQDVPAKFAEALYNHGMNAQDAITGSAEYPTRTIGGVDCWMYQGDYDTYYYGYMPDENAFITVYVSENDQSDYVDPLIDSVSFNVPAYEGEVTPWYWEGTPYSVSEHNTMVGSFTVTGRQLPLDQVNPTYKIFDARLQVSGNDYYILDNELLKKYTRDGDTLKYDSDIALPYEPEEIAVDSEGTIYISDFGSSMIKIQNGTEITVSSDTKYVAVDPTCTWGISYFTSNEVSKIDLTNGAITSYTLDGIKLITHLFVTDHYIVLSCTPDEEDAGNCLKIYDTDFNELCTLNSDGTTTGYYGSVSAVTETANGLIVFDGNMRDVYFLDTNLQLITAIDMSDLLGTDYPWPCQAVTAEDGSVYVICTDERADDSCDEAVVFQLTGF